MKIHTITSHDVYNYGASLQAYSLMIYLQNNGHECQVIDYKPEYARGRYNFWYIDSNKKYSSILKLWPIRIIVCSILAPMRFRTIARKNRFDRFTKNYLNLTKRYRTFEDLQQENWHADAFIVGSDQVWNTDHSNGRDLANYLAFAPKKARKISYAASFGMDTIIPIYQPMVRDNLQTFNFISVRESTGVNLLAKMGLESTHVVDPVFLNSATFWSQLADKACKQTKKYILVYDFGNSPFIRKFVIHLSQCTKLPIYSLNDFVTHSYADKNINDAGPLEFLSLIKNASYFVSNSFHGTAFSIIFHVPFFVFLRRFGNVNSRMQDLLQLLNLENRIIENENQFDKWKYKIDFENSDIQIAERIRISKNVLLKCLE